MILPGNTRIKGGKSVRAQLWHRLQPYDGDIVLESGSPDWADSFAVLEPSVFETPAGVEIWYTVRVTATVYAIARSVATDINSTFVKDDYYIGNGRGGTSVGDFYQGAYAWYDAGTYWVIATNGYGITAGRDSKARLFSTTNLASGFTNHGVIFQQSMFPISVSLLGNQCIVLGTDMKPALIGGKFYALCEAFVPAGFWRTFVAEATPGGGVWASGMTWTITHELTTAQPVAGAMYGGFWAMYINGVIHMANHYGFQTGDLPTYVSYCTSVDTLATAVIREVPFSFFNPFPYADETDQVADPWFVEIDGSSYFFAELCANSTVNGFESYIIRKSFPGGLSGLFSGLYRNATQSPL